jgi:hypothetical protein
MSNLRSRVEDIIGGHQCDNPECVEKRPQQEKATQILTLLYTELEKEAKLMDEGGEAHEEDFIEAVPLERIKELMIERNE